MNVLSTNVTICVCKKQKITREESEKIAYLEGEHKTKKNISWILITRKLHNILIKKHTQYRIKMR